MNNRGQMMDDTIPFQLALLFVFGWVCGVLALSPYISTYVSGVLGIAVITFLFGVAVYFLEGDNE